MTSPATSWSVLLPGDPDDATDKSTFIVKALSSNTNLGLIGLRGDEVKTALSHDDDGTVHLLTDGNLLWTAGQKCASVSLIDPFGQTCQTVTAKYTKYGMLFVRARNPLSASLAEVYLRELTSAMPGLRDVDTAGAGDKTLRSTLDDLTHEGGEAWRKRKFSFTAWALGMGCVSQQQILDAASAHVCSESRFQHMDVPSSVILAGLALQHAWADLDPTSQAQVLSTTLVGVESPAEHDASSNRQSECIAAPVVRPQPE